MMHSKDAERMENNVDTDQTALSAAVWSGSALFAQTYLSQYMYLVTLDQLLQASGKMRTE